MANAKNVKSVKKVEDALRELEALFDVSKDLPGQIPYFYQRLVALQAQPLSMGERSRLYRLRAMVISEMEPETLAELEGCEASREAVHRRVTEAAREAVTFAQQSGDRRLEASAQRTLGVMCRRAGFIPEAAEAFRASVALYEETGATREWADERTRIEHLDALVRLTGMEIMLGNFDEAQRYLDTAVAARQKINKPDEKALEFGQISWMQAMISRPRDDELLKSLTAAMHAADIYARQGASPSLNRILLITTEIALDLAEASDPIGTARADFMKSARQYLGYANDAIKRHHEVASAEMAKLDAARLRRIENPTTTVALNQVRAVVAHIDKTRNWDAPLRIDAYTALGRELVAQARSLREMARRQRVPAKALALEAEARAAFEVAVTLAEQEGTPGAAWIASNALQTPPLDAAPPDVPVAPIPVAVHAE